MVNTKTKRKRGNKAQAGIELILLVVVIIIVNLLSGQYYKRIDLTKEKRYTLSETSKKLAEQVNDKMYFKVYLEGKKLSSKFKRLKTSTIDMLNEFRDLSGGKIEFDFADPFEGKSNTEKEEIIKQVVEKGGQPYNDIETDLDQQQRNLILPVAEVNYAGKTETYVVNLLSTELGRVGESAINKSIENLEYEIANVIRKCINKRPKRIGFLYGHGELEEEELGDLTKALSENYTVERVLFNLHDTAYQKKILKDDLPNTKNGDSLFSALIAKSQKDLSYYDGLIIAKPTVPLADDEAFILDQYFMGGGKMMWMIEPVHADMDSLEQQNKMICPDYNNENAMAMLSKYGATLNSNLLQDLNCNAIMLADPMRQGNFVPFGWIYYPVFNNTDNNHPIVRNLEAVWGRFTGNIKPTSRENLKISNLLVSSPRTKLQFSPAVVDLNIVTENRNPKYIREFKGGQQIVGALFEGEFKSFAYRPGATFKYPVKKSVQNSMIVIADGDIARNDVKRSTGEIMPLGYDRKTERLFANKKFMLNCFDYLFDESGLIEVRTKEISLRLLDKPRINAPKQEEDWMSEKTKWQLINTITPVVAIIIFGIANAWIRRRKYAR